MLKRRNLLVQIKKHVPDKRHTIITGARQVGKTSLLRLLLRDLTAENQKAFLLTFEDKRVLEHINIHPENIFDFVPTTPIPITKGITNQKIFLLIDEVQYADDPTNFLKYLYDTYQGNVKIIATGSSAFYIDRKFKDSLAGRKRIFNLLPLSFSEFLNFKKAETLKEELQAIKEKDSYQSLHEEALKQFFYEYLTYGGYPAIVLENDIDEKAFLLEELKNSYVKRDMLESNVSKEGKFFLLLQLLADQIGNLLNKNELSRKLQVDIKTIDNYVYILEKCYHVYLIRPFFRNLRKELTKMPKIYFNDLGLRNALLNRFEQPLNRADAGQLLENFFFSEMRQYYSREQIRFWRTSDKQEIDFVVEESFGTGKAYEVKWNAGKFRPKKYDKFRTAYPQFELGFLSAKDYYFFTN